MATEWRLTPSPLAFKPQFPATSDLVLDYDAAGDVLSVSLCNAGPAISVDLDQHAWARVVPASGQVVGYEIEEFERGFLPRHPELAQLWQSRTRSEMQATSASGTAAFVEALTGRLRELLLHDIANAATP